MTLQCHLGFAATGLRSYGVYFLRRHASLSSRGSRAHLAALQGPDGLLSPAMCRKVVDMWYASYETQIPILSRVAVP